MFQGLRGRVFLLPLPHVAKMYWYKEPSQKRLTLFLVGNFMYVRMMEEKQGQVKLLYAVRYPGK